MPITRRTFWNLGLFVLLLLTTYLAVRERSLTEDPGHGRSGGHPSPPAPPEPSRPSLDLLQIISVPRDVVNGEWTLDPDGLTTGGVPYSRLLLVPPPGEYDFIALVERKQGEDSLDLGLVADSRQFLAVIDGWTKGELTGIDLIEDKPFFGNPTTYGGRLLPRDKAVEIRCSVRKNRVTLQIDGKPIFDWPADFSKVRLYREWEVPNRSSLFIGTYATRFQIRKLTLVDRSGG
jgi:hypothetical protein